MKYTAIPYTANGKSKTRLWRNAALANAFRDGLKAATTTTVTAIGRAKTVNRKARTTRTNTPTAIPTTSTN